MLQDPRDYRVNREMRVLRVILELPGPKAYKGQRATMAQWAPLVLLEQQDLDCKARLDYKEQPELRVRKVLPEPVYRDQPVCRDYKGQQVTMARLVLPVQLVRQDLGCKAQPEFRE